MRALGRAALAVTALLLAGFAFVAVANRLLDRAAVRASLAEAVRARSGAELRFDDATLGLLPPRLVLERPALALVEGGVPPVLSADTAALRVSLLRLLRTRDVVQAVRGIEIRGDALRGQGTVSDGGDLELDLDLDGMDARALVPWIPLHSVDGRGTLWAEVRAGTVTGRVHVEVAAAGALTTRASLAFADTDAVWSEASAKGAFALELDATGDRDGRWSGRFDLDVAGAEVAHGALRKRAGQPMRATGVLEGRAYGIRGFALRGVRVEPFVLEAFPGSGPQLQIHIGEVTAGEVAVPPRRTRSGDP